MILIDKSHYIAHDKRAVVDQQDQENVQRPYKVNVKAMYGSADIDSKDTGTRPLTENSISLAPSYYCKLNAIVEFETDNMYNVHNTKVSSMLLGV